MDSAYVQLATPWAHVEFASSHARLVNLPSKELAQHALLIQFSTLLSMGAHVQRDSIWIAMEFVTNLSFKPLTAPMANTSTKTMAVKHAVRPALPVSQQTNALPAQMQDILPIPRESAFQFAEMEWLLVHKLVTVERLRQQDACHAESNLDLHAVDNHLCVDQLLLPLKTTRQSKPIKPMLLAFLNSARQTSTQITCTSLWRLLQCLPFWIQPKCKASSKPPSHQEQNPQFTVPKGTHPI